MFKNLNVHINKRLNAKNDYDAFGMLMPNRHGSTDSYRYGFNGMEKDDEIKGEGNSYDFGARMYDSRIGRWFAIDYFQNYYSNQSNYSFALNDPINIKDKDGNIAVDKDGNPIYTSQGYALKNMDGVQVLIENRTYFSNRGEKIIGYKVIGELPVGLKNPTQEDIKVIDKRFKSFCYTDALYMTQLKKGGHPDDPIADNFEIVN